jgi:SPP1 family predicted phage head-tail adaptor
MPSGDLDRYIRIERFTATDNNYGEGVKTWSLLSNVWAQKIEVTSSEGVKEDQITAKQVTQWRVRYNSNISVQMRILYNNEYYNITSVQEEGRGAYMLLNSFKTDG